MEIQDLYTSSIRLVRDVDCRFKRYMYFSIDWEDRMLCIRGAKHGKSNMINFLNHVLFSFTHTMYKYLMLTKLIKYYEILFIEGII